MRLVYVVSYYKPAYVYGGPARSISSLCEGLAQLGVAVTVLTTHANGGRPLDVPLGQPVQVDGVEVIYHRLGHLPPRSYFFSPDLARACARRIGQFDLAVLDALYSHAMLPAVSACRRAGVPYIAPLRGQLLPWALRHKRLKKWLYFQAAGLRLLNGAAALLCTDAHEAEAAARLGLRPPAFVAPNGLDTRRFEQLPPRGGLRASLNIPPEATVLLFLGRLVPKKRPDIAVAALAAAQSSAGDVHLLVAGPDEQHMTAGLQAQANALGCGGRLHLTGLLQDGQLLQAMADADLLLMPSSGTENFGMAAAEALAAGLPVLASEGVPVGRAAQAAGAGRAVPCSPEAFGQATLEMLGDLDGLRAMGRRGRELARREYAAPAVAQKMLAHCRAIVETGRPQTADGGRPQMAAGEAVASKNSS